MTQDRTSETGPPPVPAASQAPLAPEEFDRWYGGWDPLDPSTLSRDPAVGRDYEADDLVWHGPFRRTTLRALQAALGTISAGPGLGGLPTLWVHGGDDQLVPIVDTRAHDPRTPVRPPLQS